MRYLPFGARTSRRLQPLSSLHRLVSTSSGLDTVCPRGTSWRVSIWDLVRRVRPCELLLFTPPPLPFALPGTDACKSVNLCVAALEMTVFSLPSGPLLAIQDVIWTQRQRLVQRYKDISDFFAIN